MKEVSTAFEVSRTSVLEKLFFVAFAFSLVMTFSAPCDAAPMELVLEKIPQSRLRDNVRRALELFKTREGQADRTFLEQLQQREDAYRRNPNKVVGRQGMDVIRGVRSWMSDGGVLPPCDEILPDMIAYATEVAQAREKMIRPTTALATSLRRQKLDPLADAVQSALLELGKVLQTTETLKEGSVWLGYRQHADSSDKVRIKLRITTMADHQFVGRVDKNPQWSNHPAYELTGVVDGAIVKAKTGRKINLSGGDEGSWSYVGYVIGRTIIGKFNGRTKAGKPGGGFFRVDYRGN